jgi:FkbM family methyltransferase
VRRRRVVLPSGIAVEGATPADVRSQHFVLDYFRRGLEIRPGMTVVDVGANIGFFSLEVLRRGEGRVHLHAFEPAPDTFARLARNVREAFPDAPVTLHCSALGDRQGSGTLYHRPRVSVSSSLHAEPLGDPEDLLSAMLRRPPAEYRDVAPAWFRQLPPRAREGLLRAAARWAHGRIVETPCTVTTLSQVLHDAAIETVDFLKIDVEGAEREVLDGIQPDDWPRIRRLAAEVHDLAGRLDAMRAVLREAGFDEIEVTQDWPFEGTNVHMLHAARTG